MKQTFLYSTIAAGLLIGCAGDETTGLAIERADDTSLSGVYQAHGATLRFESRRDGDAITARFFDDAGVVVAGRHAGAEPAGWRHDTAPADAVLALLPEAIDAIAAADVDPALGDALVELGADSAALDPSAEASGPALTQSVSFWAQCGARNEYAYVGARNMEYVSRYATVTIYASAGSVRYTAWVGPRSVRFFYYATRYITNAYGVGGGNMSFYNAGNGCL